jgi:CubicO group peptidase (beta-lactamase class C family)
MKARARLIYAGALTVVMVVSGFAQSLKQPARAVTSFETRLSALETELEAIRRELKIPALSAAIVKDQKVVWARGFGHADLENKIPATEKTAYHLASLTKTFASTILMQLVEQGKIKLDDPVSKYGIRLESEGVIRIRHLLSHTSEGNPGERYSYNGNRFAELDKVIQKATGKTYAELLISNILEPLAMNSTAPAVGPAVRTESPGATDPKAEQELKAAAEGFFASFNTGQVAEIEKYLARERNGFANNGGLLSLFADTAELRRQFQAGVRVAFDVKDLGAAVYGETGLVTSIAGGIITLPGGDKITDGPWRTTLVWNKQGGAWKIVHGHMSALEAAFVTESQRQRFDAVSKIMAQPYMLDRSFNPVKDRYPNRFSTSAGLVSTVLDMAKYDIAIDQNRFLKKETQQLAFTPAVSTRGEQLPYGLGWFTQNHKGLRLIWHYGYWQCNSSLILKVPERNITFIAMANTDNLSRPTDLGAGDVTSSPVGLAFLNIFIHPELFGLGLEAIDWSAPSDQLQSRMKQFSGKAEEAIYKKELLVRSRMYASVGRLDETTRLFRVYGALYTRGLPEELRARTTIAEIINVADDANQTVEFTLAVPQKVRVFAAGEGQGEELFDYGWIESADTGKPVWEMKGPRTAHAGGAGKNRKVDTIITLGAGKYRLRYKSDDSHSFDRWNALPPDINFWGIALYAEKD